MKPSRLMPRVFAIFAIIRMSAMGSTGLKQKQLLDELVEEYRGKYDYDCIVPFSGGKDSTWTLYYLVKEYNLETLGGEV